MGPRARVRYGASIIRKEELANSGHGLAAGTADRWSLFVLELAWWLGPERGQMREATWEPAGSYYIDE